MLLLEHSYLVQTTKVWRISVDLELKSLRRKSRIRAERRTTIQASVDWDQAARPTLCGRGYVCTRIYCCLPSPPIYVPAETANIVHRENACPYSNYNLYDRLLDLTKFLLRPAAKAITTIIRTYKFSLGSIYKLWDTFSCIATRLTLS